MGVNISFTPIFFVYSLELYHYINFHINRLWKL
nr:MAG TPA: hypothetical protein [Caudoviricetes sp.]